MVNRILTGAGFIENQTYKETRFLKPPNVTFAVYNDSKTSRGSDDTNFLIDHEVNIEVYEYTPDPGIEKKIEAELDSLGLEWIKQSRYWIAEEQLYQIIYEFSYVEKKGA